MLTRTFFALVVVACLSAAHAADGDGTPAATAESARQAIADAEAAYRKANAVGGAWRDTLRMIEEAKFLLAEQKFEAATRMARQAERQGSNGYEQADRQKDLGKNPL